MRGFGFTFGDVQQAASAVGLRAVGSDVDGLARESYGGSRARCHFTLKLDSAAPRREDGALPFQRVSMARGIGEGRRVAAVCWHGHRDVMRALFERFPEARLKTALADYRGREDFEEKYLDTYGNGNGYHLSYGQACVCGEGWA